MKYSVYFIWNDGFKDSLICNNAKERSLIINNMIKRKEFKSISYCKIYNSGEYGKTIKVF